MLENDACKRFFSHDGRPGWRYTSMTSIRLDPIIYVLIRGL